MFQIILMCLLIKQHIVGIWCKLVFYRKYYDKLKRKDVIKFKIRWYIFFESQKCLSFEIYNGLVLHIHEYGKQCLKDSYVIFLFFFLSLDFYKYFYIYEVEGNIIWMNIWLLPNRNIPFATTPMLNFEM